MSNYFVSKDSKIGEIVYLEYDKKGYKVKPKTTKKDAIEVNKIVFVSPELTKKLLKKKIDHKISKLLLELNTIDDEDNGDPSRVRNMLVEAERLKLMIINTYRKYLGNSYTTLTLKKMEIIIDGFRKKLYTINAKKQQELLIRMMELEAMEASEKKGKGR